MSDTILELKPLAPLLLRDGRPFSSGSDESRAQSLPVPLPQTLAGFVRTQLGNQQNWNWHNEQELRRYLQDLHGIPVRSVLVRNDQFMFPVPKNAVIDKQGTVYRSIPEPLQEGEGCDLPNGLQPLMLQPQPDDQFKPDSDHVYWSKENMITWLSGKNLDKVPPKIIGPIQEERTHVQIDSKTGVGVDGALFSVTYRSFEIMNQKTGDYHRWAIRIKTDVKEDFATFGHLGGERRPVTLTDLGNKDKWPNISAFKKIEQELIKQENKRICFILTSPALFDDGWKPAWLEKDLGPHNPAGVGILRGKAKLVGAAVGRRVPISGWSMRENKPRKVRWAVPAGSVYFLEITEEVDRTKLLTAWMKPLSDKQDDQRDGFGCALWGVW